MSERNTDIVSYLPLPSADPLSIHPTTISQYAFKKRYSEFLAKYPFSPGYVGLTNPFTGHIIKSKNEYILFLREYAYYSFCRDFEERFLESEEAAQYAEDRVERLLQVEKDRNKKAENNLKAELQAEINKRKEAEGDTIAARNSMKQAQDRLQRIEDRRGYEKVAIVVLLLLSIIVSFFIGNNRGKSSGFKIGQDSGYKAGVEKGQNEGSDKWYSSGYEKGKSDGYREGYSDGVSDGYDTGYIDGSLLGSSYYSNSRSNGNGSTRDTPIADAYIGNRSSKKFHLPSCSYLPNQSNQVTFDSRSEAIEAGYQPCGHCHP